ncbi:hypothetical protein HYU23_01095 [Candidatus Woesearchaeota archaeon]|nr:hypothetical protein [Candidatus Woesearchaeota archaeon]
MKSLTNLERRKIELIRNIQLCQKYKRKIIEFSQELEKQYREGRITYDQYKSKLNTVLKNRSCEQWVNYYNKCIENYRNKLEVCSSEIKKENIKTKALQTTAILGVLGLFILTLLLVRPEITGFAFYESGTVNESIYFEINNFIPNSSIVQLEFDNKNYTKPVNNFLSEISNKSINNETVYGYNISNLTINSTVFEIPVPTKSGNYSLVSRIIDNNTILAENLTEITVGKTEKDKALKTTNETNLTEDVNLTQSNITETFDNITIPTSPNYTIQSEISTIDSIIEERNITISKNNIEDINVLSYSAEEITLKNKNKKTLIIHKPIINGKLFDEAIPLDSKDEFTYTSTFEDTTIDIEFDSKEIKKDIEGRKFSKAKYNKGYKWKIENKFLLPANDFKVRYRISSSSPIDVIDYYDGYMKSGKFEVDFKSEREAGYNIEVKKTHSNIVYVYLSKDYGINNKSINDEIVVDPTLTISGGSQTLCGEVTAYDKIEVINTGTLLICPYNASGQTGYVNISLGDEGNFTIDSTSIVSGSGRGGRNGTGCSGNTCTATQGENNTGSAGTASNNPNGGGGGGGTRASGGDSTGGGGAGFGGVGGEGGYSSAGTKGKGGLTSSDGTNLTLLFGAGGGGSASDATDATAAIGGDGGAGFRVNASNGFIYIHGLIDVNGSAGGAGGSTDQSGGGGGSGGHVILISRNLTLSSTGRITAKGGNGGSASGSGTSDSCGGGGAGGGRIVYRYGALVTAAGFFNTSELGTAGTGTDGACDASTDAGNSTSGTNGTISHTVTSFPSPFPEWYDVQRNTTTVYNNTLVVFNATWRDYIGLNTYMFEINFSSSGFYNTSAITFGAGNVSTNTSLITGVPGTTVYWRFYGNDTKNNMNQTDLQTFTISSGSPIVLNVTSIAAQSITEAGITNVSFDYVAADPAGFSATATAQGHLNRTEETYRYNATCQNMFDLNSTARVYRCTVPLYWFDGAGTWTASANISNNNLNASNNSVSFTVESTKAFVMAPTALRWPTTIISGQVNQLSINHPIILNNTGNVNIGVGGGVTVTAIDLIGEVTGSYWINSSNFTSNPDLSGCATDAPISNRLANNTLVTITGAALNKGNYTINDGTAQEQLYFCLEEVGVLLPQSYSTFRAGSWTIGII